LNNLLICEIQNQAQLTNLGASQRYAAIAIAWRLRFITFHKYSWSHFDPGSEIWSEEINKFKENALLNKTET
jgi:hypothetical protein